MKPVKKNRKQKLLDRAQKAHEKGRKKGRKVVGMRTIANPRFLDPVKIPVFAREQRLRDRAKNIEVNEKTGKIINRGGGWKFGIPGLKNIFKGDASWRAGRRTRRSKKQRCRGGWCR
jgi:hypothetical protein